MKTESPDEIVKKIDREIVEVEAKALGYGDYPYEVQQMAVELERLKKKSEKLDKIEKGKEQARVTIAGKEFTSRDLREMADKVSASKYFNQYSEIIQGEKELEKTEKLDLNQNDLSTYAQAFQRGVEDSRNKHQPFLGIDTFGHAIPLCNDNIVLIGAVSGHGKSTVTANLALTAVEQGKSVLLISNEEEAKDIFGRIACLYLGYDYRYRHNFTDNELSVLIKVVEVLENKLTIVDHKFKEIQDVTTTVEGLELLLRKAADEKKYDLVIIDYYQKFSRSLKHQRSTIQECLYQVANILDQYKSNFPIAVMAQLKPINKNTLDTFETRIKERTYIYIPSTCAIELIPDKDNSSSIWTIHKSRNREIEGKSVVTGYKKGRFVKAVDLYNFES